MQTPGRLVEIQVFYKETVVRGVAVSGAFIKGHALVFKVPLLLYIGEPIVLLDGKEYSDWGRDLPCGVGKITRGEHRGYTDLGHKFAMGRKYTALLPLGVKLEMRIYAGSGHMDLDLQMGTLKGAVNVIVTLKGPKAKQSNKQPPTPSSTHTTNHKS